MDMKEACISFTQIIINYVDFFFSTKKLSNFFAKPNSLILSKKKVLRISVSEKQARKVDDQFDDPIQKLELVVCVSASELGTGCCCL